MDRSAIRGPVAVVAVDLGQRDASLAAASRSGLVAAIETCADQRRGSLHVDEDDCLAVFSTAGRAMSFVQDLQDRVREGLSAGVHIGDLHERSGRLRGPAADVARTLAGHAAPGEILLSRVAHDVVGVSDHLVLAEAEGDRGLPADLVPTYLVLPATARGDGAAGMTGPPQRVVDRVRDAVQTARLTVMVAGQGMGKTAVARAIADLHPTVWLTVPAAGMRPAVFARALVDGLRIRVPGIPALLSELAGGFETDDPDEQRVRAETLAGTVVEALVDRLPRDLLLVVDGIERLAPWPVCLALLEALARNSPADLHLLLLGRRDPGLRTNRLDSSGRFQTIGEDDLRLTREEMSEAIAQAAPGAGEVETAAAVRLAGGIPEVLRLVAAHRRRVGGAMPASSTNVVSELLARRDEADRVVLDALAALGPSDAGLLARVTGLSSIDVDGLLLDGLVRPVGMTSGQVELGAAAAAVVATDEDARRRHRVTAARMLRSEGNSGAALALLGTVGADEAIVEILRDDGRHLLAEGGWPSVLEAMGGLAYDPAAWDPALGPSPIDAGLLGEAWRLAGDHERALTWFALAAEGTDRVPAWLAWRMGVLLHFAGELDQVRELYGRLDPDGAMKDLALARAWEAAAAWLQSDIDGCRPAAAEAMRLARESADDAALAAAHTAQALLAAVDGDRASNDQHYLRALVHAERAGDVLQLVRIHTNRGSRLLEEGEHAEALAELELALRIADFSSALSLHGMALSNRGQVLRRLGRLDEATADLAASREIFERIGSRWVAYALSELGEIYDVRGERGLALASHEEAIAQCEPVGDTQGTIPAYAGLARLLVVDDLERAKELAEAASAHPEALGHAIGLAAVAEVALAAGDRVAAAEAVEAGLQVARQRRDRPGIATHLELRARASEDDHAARRDLEEARDLWGRMHCPLEEARATVALALVQPTADSRLLAERALQTLRALGARTWAESAGRLLAALDGAGSSPLHVDVLGGLTIRVAGTILPERAHPTPDAVEFLAHAIAAGAGHRVGTSAGVLGLWSDAADREERVAAAVAEVEDFLARHGAASALSNALAIDPGVVTSDLHVFLSTSSRGLAAYRDGRTQDATDLLTVAESTYGGTLLEGRSAAAWLAVARDDAAEAYLQVVMALVDLAEQAGDNHGAVRLLLRVIERDPHDEGAHLRLVACLERSGRRGESRRRYRTYTSRMQEIGVEPAPFPDVKLAMVP